MSCDPRECYLSLSQVQETFLTTSNQTMKFRRAKCFLPPPPSFPFLCPTPATVVIMILITIDVRHPPLRVAFSGPLLDQRQGPCLISIWTSEEMWSRGVLRYRGTIVPVLSVLPHIYVSHPWLGHMRLLDVCSSQPSAEVVLKCMARVGLPFLNCRVKVK